MIDLHCHLLPGIDDGASDIATAVAMARALVADGVEVVACTPHILPGVYANRGPQILAAIAALEVELAAEAIPLKLVSGADNHIAPNFVADLRAGVLLPLAGSRYVLVEPPHHVLPPRLEALFFDICVAGYVPILTHPERLVWVGQHYDMMARLVDAGVWMQITAGSLAGTFGAKARQLAERMLDDGLVHILASDAHDPVRRPPDLARGRALAALRVGEAEATHLVDTRPRGILDNAPPSILPALPAPATPGVVHVDSSSHQRQRVDTARPDGRPSIGSAGGPPRDGAGRGGVAQRLRRLFS